MNSLLLRLSHCVNRRASAAATEPAHHCTLTIAAALIVVCAVSKHASAQTTDATFAFTSDVHVAFNGVDDHQGIEDDVFNLHYSPNDLLLLKNETALSILEPNSHSDACVGNGFSIIKDLCNQIQLLRKLNHLPTNVWNPKSFMQNGHSTALASAGLSIGTPQGLIVGGDLTDCGAGSFNVKVWDWKDFEYHSEDCDVDYGKGTEGAELALFKQLFDESADTFFVPLGVLPMLQGLKNPDGDAPLRFPVYPELGNHDLGFDRSGDMMNYIREWNTSQPVWDPHHVLNSDSSSGSYSWNWGKLHIINAGIFAGSNNQSGPTPSTNHPYDQNAMNWIANDLQTYASDGRPVILTQHFGFDSYSWSSNWYLADSAIEGARNLWAVLAPYNVIGIFHGHNHGEAIYSFADGDAYANGSRTNAGHLPYDIFDDGAGFAQDFMVARVTDKEMDVQATQSSKDFDDSGTTVQFGDFFNKRLVPPPTAGTFTTVESYDTLAASLSYAGDRFLLGTNLLGHYTLRVIDDKGNAISLLTGQLPLAPSLVTSFNAGNNGYFLLSDGNTIVCYQVISKEQMTKQWSIKAPLNSMTVVYSTNGIPYLLTEEANSGPGDTVSFNFFQIARNGLVERGTFPLQGVAVVPDLITAQMTAVLTSDGGFTVVRLLNSGIAEIYHGSIDSHGDTQLAYQQDEQWVADSIYQGSPSRRNVLIQPVILQDKSVGILVKSPDCSLYDDSGNCQTINNVDSPYSVRTLTQDQTGTQISWRGAVPLAIPFDAVSLVPLDAVDGVPQVGLFSSNGFLSRINVAD